MGVVANRLSTRISTCTFRREGYASMIERLVDVEPPAPEHYYSTRSVAPRRSCDNLQDYLALQNTRLLAPILARRRYNSLRTIVGKSLNHRKMEKGILPQVLPCDKRRLQMYYKICRTSKQESLSEAKAHICDPVICGARLSPYTQTSHSHA